MAYLMWLGNLSTGFYTWGSYVMDSLATLLRQNYDLKLTIPPDVSQSLQYMTEFYEKKSDLNSSWKLIESIVTFFIRIFLIFYFITEFSYTLNSVFLTIAMITFILIILLFIFLLLFPLSLILIVLYYKNILFK